MYKKVQNRILSGKMFSFHVSLSLWYRFANKPLNNSRGDAVLAARKNGSCALKQIYGQQEIFPQNV